MRRRVYPCSDSQPTPASQPWHPASQSEKIDKPSYFKVSRPSFSKKPSFHETQGIRPIHLRFVSRFHERTWGIPPPSLLKTRHRANLTFSSSWPSQPSPDQNLRTLFRSPAGQQPILPIPPDPYSESLVAHSL